MLKFLFVDYSEYHGRRLEKINITTKKKNYASEHCLVLIWVNWPFKYTLKGYIAPSPFWVLLYYRIVTLDKVKWDIWDT